MAKYNHARFSQVMLSRATLTKLRLLKERVAARYPCRWKWNPSFNEVILYLIAIFERHESFAIEPRFALSAVPVMFSGAAKSSVAGGMLVSAGRSSSFRLQEVE